MDSIVRNKNHMKFLKFRNKYANIREIKGNCLIRINPDNSNYKNPISKSYFIDERSQILTSTFHKHHFIVLKFDTLRSKNININLSSIEMEDDDSNFFKDQTFEILHLEMLRSARLIDYDYLD